MSAIIEEVRARLRGGQAVTDTDLLLVAADELRARDEQVAELDAQVTELTAENVELVVEIAALRYRFSRKSESPSHRPPSQLRRGRRP
jgi:regulator of replication initiation timing